MAPDMRRKWSWTLGAAWLVLSCLSSSAMAQEQPRGQALARPDNAVIAENIKREMTNPAVLKLQKLYADAGVTSGQMERLQLMDARAFAMARFATTDDIQEFHSERATLLSPEQMQLVTAAATEDFRARLRGRTRLNPSSSVTSDSLNGYAGDATTSTMDNAPDNDSTPTLEIVPISSADDETTSGEKPTADDSGDSIIIEDNPINDEGEVAGEADSTSVKDGEATASQSGQSGDE